MCASTSRFAIHETPWHRYPMSPQFFRRISALMWRWNMVAIPMFMVKRGQCLTHQCKRQCLVLHQTTHVVDAIITNPLDKQQQLVIQQDESARRRTQLAATLESRRGYVFTPPSVEERICQTSGRTLATWVISADPTSPGEVATRQAPREKYLQPNLTT